VVPAQTVNEAIASAKRVLTIAQENLHPVAWLQSKKTADHLLGIVEARLQEVKTALDREINNGRPSFIFSVSEGISHPDILPGLLDDIRFSPKYDRAFSLRLTSPAHDRRSITVRARGIGAKFRGLIGVETSFRDWTGGESVSEPFQINYVESPDNAERRFRPWLERSLAHALTLWRQSL
jgi:hypothetical protein